MELFFNFFFNVEVFRFGGMGVGGNDGRNEVMCGGKRRLFVFRADSIESLVERAEWTLGSVDRDSLAKDRA